MLTDNYLSRELPEFEDRTYPPFPDIGYVRLPMIIGDAKSRPQVPPRIPVSNTAWWQGIKDGIYPPPIKLSERTTVWRVSDIRQLIETGVWSSPESKPNNGVA